MTVKERINHIRQEFEKLYPDADCSLQTRNALQLMISAQLATQCTDARVNIVTKDLYQKYKTAEDFANANLSELEQDIKSTGFYHNKAKNIIASCRMILTDFGGQVPSNMEDLLKLPGVGRKIANLVLGDVYGIPGIVTDTHAIRLAGRMGFTKSTNPVQVERDLLKIVPKDYQTKFCHQLVLHGRAVCPARGPKCGICTICDYCKTGIEHRKAASQPSKQKRSKKAAQTV